MSEAPDETDERKRRRRAPELSPEENARQEAEAVRLGRFLPLGMVLGAIVGGLLGWITGHPGVLIPVGIACGILVAGTLPVFLRRS